MRTIAILLLVLGVWVALLPPFFTHGACTAEFDAASEALQQARPAIGTLAQAQDYLASRAMQYQVLSAERCQSAPPADVEICPGGPLVLVAVPVKDRICHYYRDSSIRLQLGYNSTLQLVRIQTDMNPYRTLKLPLIGVELYWAK